MELICHKASGYVKVCIALGRPFDRLFSLELLDESKVKSNDGGVNGRGAMRCITDGSFFHFL